MRKIKKEKKKVEVEKDVIVEDITYCDICGKVIPGAHWCIHRIMPNGENTFTGKDACSESCIKKELKDYLDESAKEDKGGDLFEIFYVPAREVEDDYE